MIVFYVEPHVLLLLPVVIIVVIKRFFISSIAFVVVMGRIDTAVCIAVVII